MTTERRVIIGEPENIEPGLEATLARFFVQRPAAESVRLGWLVHPDSSAGYVLIVVSADADGAVDGLGAVETPGVTGGESLDVIVMPPGSTDQVLTDIPPFYVRPPRPTSLRPTPPTPPTPPAEPAQPPDRACMIVISSRSGAVSRGRGPTRR